MDNCRAAQEPILSYNFRAITQRSILHLRSCIVLRRPTHTKYRIRYGTCNWVCYLRTTLKKVLIAPWPVQERDAPNVSFITLILSGRHFGVENHQESQWQGVGQKLFNIFPFTLSSSKDLIQRRHWIMRIDNWSRYWDRFRTTIQQNPIKCNPTLEC